MSAVSNQMDHETLASALSCKSVTFTVDDIQPANVNPINLIPTTDVKRVFSQGHSIHIQEVIESSGLIKNDLKWVTKSRYLHGFFAGAFTAFADHHPFTMKADHIMQLVLEGWSQHVEMFAEPLRQKFVFHQGKKVIRLRRDDFEKGNPNNDWSRVFDEFCTQIKASTTAGLYDIVSGEPFSTTQPNEQMARNISLMSLTKHYFDFRFSTCCGFPSITLEGTLDDWILLKRKVSKLKDFMMDDFASKWLPALDSIIDQFIHAYRGQVDKLFWSSMVKHYSTFGSGGNTYITGWINILFPYLAKRENQLAHKTWSELQKYVESNGGPHHANGPSVDDFGHFFCAAPVIWEYFDNEIPLTFKAGFVGSTQDESTGMITPQISWAITEQQGSKPNDCHCFECKFG